MSTIADLAYALERVLTEVDQVGNWLGSSYEEAKRILDAYYKSLAPAQAPAQAAEPVARVIFTNRRKPDVEWLVDSVRSGSLLYAAPHPSEPAATGRVGLSGETETQRFEVCAAFNDLPDSLRAHPGLKRLYRALGGGIAPTGSAAPEVG